MADNSPNIFCVRGYDSEHGGPQARRFVEGGYIAIGWFENLDLSTITDREQLHDLYPHYHPEDTSPNVIGQQVGQIARFLFGIKPGDIVVTPSYDPDCIYWGKVKDGGVRYEPQSLDGCPFPHRRPVEWNKDSLQRNQFSTPLKYSMGSSLTVFAVKHKQDFLEAIGHKEWLSQEDVQAIQNYRQDYEQTVIERIINRLEAKEFEILVTELLRTLGFTAEHKGKSGDYGVDVEGDLDIYNLASVKLVVQVKRYQPTRKVSEKEVIALRMNRKLASQLAFITTSDFENKALEAARHPDFEPIGLMNGSGFVRLLTDKWEELLERSDNEVIEDVLKKLGLRRGLVIEDN
jgi:restriction system protein